MSLPLQSSHRIVHPWAPRGWSMTTALGALGAKDTATLVTSEQRAPQTGLSMGPARVIAPFRGWKGVQILIGVAMECPVVLLQSGVYELLFFHVLSFGRGTGAHVTCPLSSSLAFCLHVIPMVRPFWMETSQTREIHRMLDPIKIRPPKIHLPCSKR